MGSATEAFPLEFLNFFVGVDGSESVLFVNDLKHSRLQNTP
jgi:hypothetical protein